MIRILEPDRYLCEWPKCVQLASEIHHIRSGYGQDVNERTVFVCAIHGSMIAKSNHDDYYVECPNCSCHFGVCHDNTI